MDILSQVLKILLKRMPPQPFLTNEMDCTDVNKDYLAKAIHIYYPNYSDTETRHILAGMTDMVFNRKEIYDYQYDRSRRRLSVFDSVFQFAE